jgi:DMSO/TMAO reductase YedYZ molybdopterin-dependent catalytic subunit
MRPRSTDWSLALGVGAAFATGLWTLISGRPERWWVFTLHGACGYLILLLLIPKLRRVYRRILPGMIDARSWAGLASTALVLIVLLSGVAWAAGGSLVIFGYSLLNWHILGGIVLTASVSVHMVARARPLRRPDLTRRQSLRAGIFLLGAGLLWPVQERLVRALNLPGLQRRFTGSREVSSFTGNAFPTVSWMADRPAPLDAATWRLRIFGLVARPLVLTGDDLDVGDELTAILDCTGGFYSEQHWAGVRVDTLLERAGVGADAEWVRFLSATGYRWSLPIAQARNALIAVRLGSEPLSHGHGAPARLVAPGERGFVWVKWLEGIEARAAPDPGQLLAINLSGFLEGERE